MISRLLSAMSPKLLRLPLALGLAALVAVSIVLGAASTQAAQSAATSQCVTCHTDAAKLKPLTPPDPPAAETGEG